MAELELNGLVEIRLVDEVSPRLPLGVTVPGVMVERLRQLADEGRLVELYQAPPGPPGEDGSSISTATIRLTGPALEALEGWWG